MTAADLKEFQPEWVEPISTTYRGWTVYELPPNTQGIAALMMLNIMEQFPLGEYGLHEHQGDARDDRGEEARLRRHAALRRLTRGSRKSPIPPMLSKAQRKARARADRSDEGRLRGRAVAASAA